MSVSELVEAFPTLGASQAHATRSEKYTQIATRPILDALYSEGYRVHAVSVASTRKDGSKRGYEKHMLRLRHVDAPVINGTVAEAVVINSHDGSCRLGVWGGFFRFICANGIVAGSLIEGIAVKHLGDIRQDVVMATQQVLAQARDVYPVLADWSATELTQIQRETFAERAHALRFVEKEGEEINAPVSPAALLSVRRPEDHKADLWTTFNTVQENLIRGGLEGRILGNNGRMRRQRLRAINGIDGNVSLNRRLFDLATETHRELIAA